MSAADYEAAQRGIEQAAEYHAVQAKLDAGHEFAALMADDGDVFLSGAWRTISAVRGESDNRVTIVCTDGTEWLARRTATRPYRPSPGEHEA